MAAREILALISGEPFIAAALAVTLLITLASFAVAVLVCLKIFKEERHERRKQRQRKRGALPVWLGRPS
jgi:hypothetical protein